ncbi:MAG: RecX family transcriptional regulator [Bacteroidales bacterium]|nr:RecX family transcriptional regulator [Bacteroidales bacterium]
MGGKPAKQNTALQRAKASLTAECSRREISSGQARQMLIQWLSKDSPLTDRQEKEIEETISSLKKDKYIDDARFARAFTRDKLRFSKWGPEKILRGLSEAGVEQSIAEEAVNDQEDLALQVLADLLSKKRQDLEKKAERKAAEDRSKLESLERQLKDSKECYRQRASVQRKIYSLQTKLRNSSLQSKAALVAFARTKGFPSKLIEKAIKDI